MNKILVGTLAASALLAGCATPGYQPYGYYNGGPQYATAPQYPVQQAAYPHYAGPPPAPAPVYAAAAPAPCYSTDVTAGQIVGGIAGALLGAQVGRGNGRTAAAAVGAATGAVVGGNLARCR